VGKNARFETPSGAANLYADYDKVITF